jgi:ketosteroid isomerase-like protein
MEENENVQLIKELFIAFGKGDIPKVLGMLSEQVEWKYPVTRVIDRDTVSWAITRNSPAEVAQFFRELGEKMVLEPFQIHGYVAQGDKVVVEGSNKGKVRSTNRAYEHDWVMVFKL